MPQPEDRRYRERDDDGGVRATDPPAGEGLEPVPSQPPGPPSSAEAESERGPIVVPEPSAPSVGIGEENVDEDAIEDLLAVAHGPAGPESLVSTSQTVLQAIEAMHGEVPKVVLGDESTEGGTSPIVNPVASEARMHLGSRGHYQVLGEIARGGMGVVLKGRDTDLGRDVALKVLHARFSKREDVLQRFVEEAQIGGQLQHPGIVPVYELGLMADDRPYFTMKLVKGRTLASLLAGRKSPEQDRRRFVNIFLQACQTIAYAHSRHVIHRDLKPANIMVGAFGEVQVVDWGLAKVIGQGGAADERKEHATHMSIIETVRSTEGSTGPHSMVGSVMGTPAYMSPEQARGQIELLDQRSDVFSLGAILCEILTGRPPYTGTNQEALKKAAGAELREANVTLTGCDAHPGLAQIAKLCIVPSQQSRPKNAKAVAQSLEKHLESADHEFERSRISAAREKGRAEAEHKSKKVAQFAATVVGVAAVASFALWFDTESQRKVAVAAEASAIADRDEAVAAAALAARTVESEAAARVAAEDAAERAKLAGEAALAEREEAEAEREAALEAGRLAARRAYRANLSAAAAALEHNDAAAVARFLGSTPVDLRGWEFDLLRSMSSQELESVELAPDVEAVERPNIGENDASYFARLSPSGSLAASILDASGERTVNVHSLESGEDVASVEIWPGEDPRFTFSGDDRYLGIQTENGPGAGVYDISQTGWAIPAGSCKAFLGFHPDGKRVALYRSGVVLLDLTSGQELRRLRGESHGLDTADRYPRAGSFSPDGAWLAVGSTPFEPLRVIEVATGAEVAVLDVPDADGLAFSPDGALLAVAADGEVVVVRTEDWETAHRLEARTSVGGPLLFFRPELGPPGDSPLRLATGGDDGMLRVYDPLDGRLVDELRGHSERVISLAYDAERDHIISSHRDGRASRWDGLRPGTIEGSTSLEFVAANDGVVYAGGHSDTELADGTPSGEAALGMNPLTGRILERVPWFQHGSFEDSKVRGLALSPNGNLLAMADGRRLRIVDRRSGDVVHLENSPDEPEEDHLLGDMTCVAWSPDGALLAVGGGLGEPRIHDGKTFELLGRLDAQESRGCDHLAFTGHGETLITASRDGRVFLWDAKGRVELADLTPEGNRSPFSSLAVHPSGSPVALGTSAGTIWIIDPSSPESAVRLEGHGDVVHALSFGVTGGRLLSGSFDRSIRIWDCESWDELVAVRLPGGVFAADQIGHRWFVGDTNEEVRVLDLDVETRRASERRADRDARQLATAFVDGIVEKNPDVVSARGRILADRSLSELGRNAALRILRTKVDERGALYRDPKRLDAIVRPDFSRLVLANMVGVESPGKLDLVALAEACAATPGLSQLERQAVREWVEVQRGYASLGEDVQVFRAAWWLAHDPSATEQELDGALDSIERARARNPEAAYLLLALGVCQMRSSDYEKALDSFELHASVTAARYPAGVALDLLGRADCRARLHDVEEAGALIARAQALIERPDFLATQPPGTRMEEVKAMLEAARQAVEEE